VDRCLFCVANRSNRNRSGRSCSTSTFMMMRIRWESYCKSAATLVHPRKGMISESLGARWLTRTWVSLRRQGLTCPRHSFSPWLRHLSPLGSCHFLADPNHPFASANPGNKWTVIGKTGSYRASHHQWPWPSRKDFMARIQRMKPCS
jgi:hypothetical protein